jgi:hypothetical protein
MKYKPSEIAEEIGCSVAFIRRTCIPAGCPHEQTDRGYYWIVGDQFRDWMLTIQREEAAKGRARLKDGQGYCVVCEKAVDMQEPLTVKPVNVNLVLVQGRCPKCGAVVCRGRERRDSDDL